MKEIIKEVRSLCTTVEVNDREFTDDFQELCKQHEDECMGRKVDHPVNRERLIRNLDIMGRIPDKLRKQAREMEKLVSWRRSRLSEVFDLIDLYMPTLDMFDEVDETQEKEK